jgi:hypothetical protein
MNPFKPSFGSMPELFAGRRDIIDGFNFAFKKI